MNAPRIDLYGVRDARVANLMGAARAAVSPRRRQQMRQAAALEYLELADAVARRFRSHSDDAHDLRQVAYVGLMKALHRYEPGIGANVASYAVPTITGEIRRYLRDSPWPVRPPREIREVAAEVAARRAETVQALGREPTAGELAALVERPRALVVEAMHYDETKQAASLDGSRVSAAEIGAFPGEPTGSEPGFERQVELSVLLSGALAALTGAERRVVRLRFDHDLTQTEIAAELAISQMQVSRLLSRALAKLRIQLSAIGVLRLTDTAD